MSLWDDIQQVAQSKSTYNPGLSRVKRTDVSRAMASRPSPRSRPVFRAGPETRLPRVELPDIGQNVSSKQSDIWSFLEAVDPTPADEESSGGGGWKSQVASGFGKLIDVVDTPRAAVVSAGEQLGKAFRGDMDASWDEWWADTSRNQGFGDIINEYHPDANRAVKLAGGFAGDVLADPLTYATFGTVKAATFGARGAAKLGASQLDNALIQGTRTGLSKEVVLQAANKSIADEAVDRLAAAAGQRGRGAFTRKGLRRAGVDEALPKQLGLTVDFGYRLGGARRGVKVPLTRTLAETSENLKGNIKKAFGSSKAGERWRQVRVSSLMGERELTQQILSGAPNAADAARGLAALRLAKGTSWRWLDETAAKVSADMPELRHMSANDLSEITHAIERGEFVGLSEKVKGFYDEVGAFLKREGVEFAWRDDYVNHTLSRKALQALKAGDHRLKAMGLDSKEAFQQGRIKEGTIQQINDEFRDQLGYNLLEDDVAVLMTRYLSQAQRALMRAHTTKALQGMNVVKTKSVVVDVSKKQAAVNAETGLLDEAIKAESEFLQEANKLRRKNLTDASRVVTQRRTETALELQAVEQQLDNAARRLGDSERALRGVEGRLRALEVAERHWNAVAKSGRSQQKRRATNQLKRLAAEKEGLLGKSAKLTKAITDLRGPKSMMLPLRQMREGLQKQYDEISMQARELSEARKALDETPLGAGEALGEDQLALHAELIRRVRDQFINASDDVSDAANAFVWATVDADTATSRLNRALVQFDEATEAIRDAPGPGRKPAADVEYRREVRAELRERVHVVQEVLRTAPDDPRVLAVAKTEAQAAAHDMSAYRARMSQKDIQRQIDVLRDPKFIDHMTRVVDDGFTAIGEDLQMPKWLDEAFDTAKRLKNPDDVTGLIRMLDGFNGWWKGWATASPGFVVRNWYSGVFNIWLDRGASAAKSMTEFRGFYKRYKRNPQEALAWAERKYPGSGPQFEGALEAAAASGWGLTPQEVSSQLVGERRTVNPFSSRNYVPGYIRDKSSDVEAILRGSHAYDVIKSGGSVSAATDQIEKFHFNYRDITDFDRAAKRVIPFWTFFSRNMALQSNVWTHAPHKLNRSYFNVKRNLELQSDEDAVVPSYFGEIGAIRTPVGEPGGGKWYLTPDLPSLRFREDLVGALGIGDDGFDPLRMLTDAGPLVKTPVELAVNRQLFTDIPFKNRAYDFDSEGNPIPREAPLWAQVPGVSNVLDQVPGVRDVGGTMTMQDNTQYALEGLWPLMGRATRLLPNQPKYEERHGQSVLSFLGAPVRQNTEQSIQGELFRQQNVSKKQREAQALDQLLREIGG